MNTVIDIFKGIIIGLANVIPGVSGGTLAVSMGIYDDLIDAVNMFLKTPFIAIKNVWKYAFGMIIGVFVAIFAVSYLFSYVPIISSMLFIGLIIGAIPQTMKKIKKGKIQVRDIIIILLVFLLVIFLGLIDLNIIEYESTVENSILIFFLLGVLIAATIVVPGISGSAVLMALGYYTNVMTMVKNTIESIITFNLYNALNQGNLLIFLGLGVIVGIFLSAKAVKKLTEKYPNTMYYGIVSLMVCSPILIMLKLDFTKITLPETICSIVTLVLGCILVKKISKGDEKTL